MSRIVARWTEENEAEHGPYALYAGFLGAMRSDDRLCNLIDDLDIDDQIALFGFVVDLLEEEATEKE